MPNDRTLVLPCGTRATVRAFNGIAQRCITDSLAEQKRLPEPDWRDRILREVVASLDDVTSTAKLRAALQALPSGSRLRLLLESRRLSYRDDLRVELECKCGVTHRQTVSLADVDDVAYADGRPDFMVTGSDGKAYTFGWGSGLSEFNFETARRSGQWGVLDQPLSLITAVDGKAMGAAYFQKLDAGLLDDLRRVGRARAPTLYSDVDPVERVTPRAVKFGDGREVEVPCAGPRTRWQLRCASCGRGLLCFLESLPDFLLPSISQEDED